MSTMLLVVQARPRPWSGQRRPFARADGSPHFLWLLDRLRQALQPDLLAVEGPREAMPADAGAALDGVQTIFDTAGPLERLLAVADGMHQDDFLMLVDGNAYGPGFDRSSIQRLLRSASRRNMDLVRFPDDFPGAFAFSLLRVSALRRAAASIIEERLPCFQPFPEHFMAGRPEAYRGLQLLEAGDALPRADDPDLAAYWRMRLEESAPGGDESDWLYDSCRYACEAAIEWTPPGGRLLALGACPPPLAALADGRVELAALPDPQQWAALPEACGDTVVCLAGTDRLPRLAARLLRPGGHFVTACPQAPDGATAVLSPEPGATPLHALRQALAQHFEILRLTGIKAGRIVRHGDPVGAWTLAVGRKRQIVAA